MIKATLKCDSPKCQTEVELTTITLMIPGIGLVVVVGPSNREPLYVAHSRVDNKESYFCSEDCRQSFIIGKAGRAGHNDLIGIIDEDGNLVNVVKAPKLH